VHVPAWHVSVCVQALPSLHDVPLAAFGFEQVPVAGLDGTRTWYWSLAVHVTGFEPVHVRAWHVSVCVHALPSRPEVPWAVAVCVHALPSLHAVPLVAFGFEQVPFAGSHMPATWHWSLAVHTTGLEPVHTPVWHVSVCVQALPSLHEVPSGVLGFVQVPVAG